jgi:general stress protein 26
MTEEKMKRAEDLVEASKTCIFANTDENGKPQAKAFLKTQAKGLKEIWICTNTSSKRAAQVQKNPESAMYFYNENTFEGLMLSGQAEIIYDDAKRKEFWWDNMTMYYPLGPTDPDYALLRFTATRGNFYCNLTNEDFDVE